MHFSSKCTITGPQIQKLFKTVSTLSAFVKWCNRTYFHQHPPSPQKKNPMRLSFYISRYVSPWPVYGDVYKKGVKGSWIPLPGDSTILAYELLGKSGCGCDTLVPKCLRWEVKYLSLRITLWTREVLSRHRPWGLLWALPGLFSLQPLCMSAFSLFLQVFDEMSPHWRNCLWPPYKRGNTTKPAFSIYFSLVWDSHKNIETMSLEVQKPVLVVKG